MVLRNVPQSDTFEQQRQEINEIAADLHALSNTVASFSLDDLIDVTAAGANNAQIIKYNGTAWVLDTDVLSSSFIMVTNAASGSGSFTYNSSTGTFTYTPPDLGGFLTSLGSVGGHTDVTISNPQNDHVLKWNGTAWVNAPENQTIVNSFVGLNDTPSTFTADKWIKVNSGGNGLEWVDSPTISAINDINDVTITNAQTNQLLKWDGNNWINFTPGYLTSFTEQDPTVPTHVKNITQANITAWNAKSDVAALNDLSDVSTAGAANGKILKYNGSSWEIADDSGTQADWAATSGDAVILNKPTLVTNLNGLSDVNTSGAANGKILKHNGTAWVVADDATGGGTTNVTTSDTAPSNPNDGDLWWKSDEGRLKIFYTDPNGNQWVDASPPLGSSGGGGATVTTDDTAPSSPSDGDLWWKSNEGQLKVYYQDADSSQWVDTGGGFVGMTLIALKDVVAASSDFADFKTRVAAL